MLAAPDSGPIDLDRSPDATEVSTAHVADCLAGRPTSRRDALTAGVIALVVVVVGIIWRSPLVPTDPWHYVRSALEFPSDTWVPLGYTRYGIILANMPPAFVFKNAQAPTRLTQPS